MKSTLPLFPSDDGWPYPDAIGIEQTADVPDLDALELLGPRAFATLTDVERDALFWHFGLQGQVALGMKDLAVALGCTRTEARDLVGSAIDKVRVRLSAE